MVGADRMIADLLKLGHKAEQRTSSDGQTFVVIPSYTVELGRFAGREIGLGLLAQPDFPRTVASAIHVKADPQLLEVTDTIPDVRNITASALGPEWRYWSRNFGGTLEGRTTERLMARINEVFRNV
jgi:hypothetical protein